MSLKRIPFIEQPSPSAVWVYFYWVDIFTWVGGCHSDGRAPADWVDVAWVCSLSLEGCMFVVWAGISPRGGCLGVLVRWVSVSTIWVGIFQLL